MKKLAYVALLGLVTLLLFGSAFAEKDVDGLETLLPHHETELERQVWAGREDQMPNLNLRDNPPVGPVRNCAEWEPTTGVMVRYPLGLPYNLLRDMDDQVKLHVVVSSGYQSQAQSSLSSNGVDMSQVEFLVYSNDSIWTRDYGPWFIVDGNGDLGIVNHTYNRPYRPNDNNIPVHFGGQQGIPVYSHSMYHTGGNYMTDGSHISASTKLVFEEAADYNGLSQSQVTDLMDTYYGVQNYNVLDYIENGGIHHIDTWAKFLDEETVLVKDVATSHHTYNNLNQRATLLASLESSTGRNYEVHRVYCYDIGWGDPASYTNSIILNDHIYVPFFGNSTHDEAALDVYRAAAPGYTVQGYYHSGFLSDDALHCRTKGIMDVGMLRVGHIPVRDASTGTVTITADIQALSGGALTEALVYYRHDGGTWQTSTLVLQSGTEYAAEIPAAMSEVVCDYYISVTDDTGRNEGMPRSQPAAHYSFLHSSGATAIGTDLPNRAARLNANYPNPFNPSTTFSFELAHADDVQLTVIDARGRLVRTLVNGQVSAGKHEILFDGKDAHGSTLASGVYYYKLRAAGLEYTRAATLLK